MKTIGNKWQINRAGLFNYWYYEDETFDFSGGKLLLRGNNGSGKSVTMQSFLPVLLDGSTRPERLDPFNSRARRMEDYLLGEKEVSGIDERTGYLYMEFKKQETDQYITIGIGLHARRGKPLKFWGFLITDNRRIGHDFSLYTDDIHDGTRVKIPLSKIQLRNRVENGGHVVDTRQEYANLVNQSIFGYETMGEYDDLIKLLIQLRSPKLSKDFKPTVIYEILEDALPPLTDEDLRHLSDTIEQMDQTKQQLEQLDLESQALSELNRVYTSYNKKVLVDQAEGFTQTSDELENEKHAYDLKYKEICSLEELISRLEKEIKEHEIDISVSEKLVDRLKQHKVWNLEKEHKEKREALEKETGQLTAIQSRLSSTREKEYSNRKSLDKVELTIHKKEKALQSILEELETDATEASFYETHRLHEDDFRANKTVVFSFSAWHSQISSHLVRLEAISEELRKLDLLKDKYAEKSRALGKVEEERDRLRHEEQDWSNWFKEEKRNQLNAIHNWMKDADHLTISDEVIQSISKQMDHLYEDATYANIREPIRDVLSDYESVQNRELAELETKKFASLKRVNELNQELTEWKNKKDPDPDTHPLTKESRQVLSKKGVHASPLYSVVEFQDWISEDTKKRIEAALLDTGLMDALITDQDTDIRHDRVLKSNPQLMAYTLADILKPDLDEEDSLSKEEVDDILRSILIDESDNQVLSISEQGNYSIGLMKGHAVPVESVRFIGRTARKRYREEKIAVLESDILAEEDISNKLDHLIDTLNQTIVSAKEQFARFPNDEDLSETYRNLEKVRFNYGQLNTQVSDLSEELMQIDSATRQLAVQLDKERKGISLQLELAIYLEAIKRMRTYQGHVRELYREHGLYLIESQRKEEIGNRLDDLEEDMLQLKGDEQVSEGRISHLIKEIDQINKQMKQEGLLDIQKEIERVQTTLEQLTHSSMKKREERSASERDLHHAEEEIGKQKERVSFWAQLKKEWQNSFETEYKRGFYQLDSTGLNCEDLARSVIKELKPSLKQETSQLVARLSRVRNDQQDYLIRYSPLQRTIHMDSPEWMSKNTTSFYQSYIDKWTSVRSRDLIEMTHTEKKVSPYKVEIDLNKERDRQKVFLDDQDKQLYEEILFHSVGNKLRARIGRAERWVDEMKALMESRQDSSGLHFSIKWKARTADTEEELDTKDLVSLLRQNPRLLKDEDIDSVTTHFRKKIDRAKALMDDTTEIQTLLQVLKQVLDYRHWFSFELSFQRTGDERKRPLTDNQFNKFSGGEKARAMYIPLFIATYSRYLEAGENAPYIISLDEAFAGVDDQNIADLFEVVEELGFNYIMNSQALWGDYETVSELAISELYRPQNADHVAVIRYNWDGKKRTLLTNEEG